ncbi:MAG: TPM domain-containing protein [Yoonia sp.]|uniref:TPM domain-containing protein n=1 Tax=Yoonia sp. TaxID=2212373 RepID=UPI003EF15E47
MKTIDETTKNAIRDRIAAVEKQCDSELVCLITRSSARYIVFPLLMASFAALFMPILGAFTPLEITFTHQTILFLALAGLFIFTPLGRVVTPKWLKQQNCERYSTEQFFRQKLHETTSRNAILIFVSWDEHFVTVVADKGINEKVAQSDWDALVSAFVQAIKNNEIERGFMDIIGGAGEMLVQHFPAQTAKTDELPNHLIALDRPLYVS